VPEELRALTIAKIRQLNEFYQMSVTDELTNLHNRREFIKRFNFEINNANNEKVSLGLIDVDYFKKVNDFYGHQMGDSVLMTLADILKEESSAAMFPARFGGEEVVLLFPGHSVMEARSLIDGIRDRFSNIDFKNGKGDIFHVSFSAGLAEYPAMADNLSHLLSRADHALYAAKEAGRGRTIIYNSVMARNDKFWEYLKTRKGVYLDPNGTDIVTKLFYLPNILELITSLDFEIESIGVMYISIAQMLEIENVRGMRNYHYEIENIARMIFLACQYHFPSDTYLALGNFFEYEFVVLFPSIVDFSYNVSRFNELCSEIACDMVRTTRMP
jgi:diguanylate cyclase (GGDEF)-like protein